MRRSTHVLAIVAAGAVLAAGIWPAASGGAGPAASPERSARQPGAAGADCYGTAEPKTVEERRLDLPLPGANDRPASVRFIRAAGLDRLVARFERRLCAVDDVDAATRLVRSTGARLWDTAVARAQGDVQLGRIDPYDDRPLYWARTTLAADLREWAPELELSSLQRQALIRILGYESRGIESVAYPSRDDVTRVLVSGFDTYSLDDSLRNSNPSGASALQLDGRRFETRGGTVVVQAVMLPVNWSDFDQGIVEDAFGPWLTRRDGVDMIMTISQTSRGRMDIEQWAGGFRGGFPDNNRAIHYGPISAAARWPQPQPSPQWIETTLPYRAMIAAGTEPWPVRLNDGICEWPVGTYPDPGSIRCQDDPSSARTQAAEAPGGNYLSNESMYRTNRLRIGAGLTDLPGGHLHISALVYPRDEGRLTSPRFERDRRAVVDQTVALVRAAGRAARNE